ncbi:MAG: PIN domain-containing protein [Deltaproteobacteria bacterium]|nr:PIN domain-containing protein [Deltaproteobacteria bacterium]
MSQPAVICDTGALVDYLVESAPDHRVFRAAIDAARARYIPGLVLAEIDYFLRAERQAMRSLIADIRRGAFIYAPPTDAQLSRAIAIDAAYADLQLGLVDATIVALADELDLRRLATRDVRHFSAVRLADGRAFDLVVIPAMPQPVPPRRQR